MPRDNSQPQNHLHHDLEDPAHPYLSLNDESILHLVFNPNLPFDPTSNLEQGDCVSNGHTSNGHHENGHIEEPDTAEVVQSKELERQGVEAADQGDHGKAADLFTSAINLAPQRPSAYNNRAQAYQLLHNIEGAVSDLDKAVELSSGRGAAACQAYTQRAIIKKLKDDEEGALEDFKMAASLGGQFARAQVIAMNPYAALCGAAVAEMMQRERNQFCESS